MRWLLLIVSFLLLSQWLMAKSQVTIQGGKVALRGGYMVIGSTQAVVVTPSVSGTTGQCIGILCGVTYN